MTDSLHQHRAEALYAVVEQRASRNILCYTPFGIVRGRLSTAAPIADLIELEGVTVEHNSNHLPTGHYERFWLGLEEITGFTLFGD